jgi:hypothetical protein
MRNNTPLTLDDHDPRVVAAQAAEMPQRMRFDQQLWVRVTVLENVSTSEYWVKGNG